jgi:hypothetical protein
MARAPMARPGALRPGLAWPWAGPRPAPPPHGPSRRGPGAAAGRRTRAGSGRRPQSHRSQIRYLWLKITGEQLGNFPQAFSHVSLINAEINLDCQLDRDAGSVEPVLSRAATPRPARR